MSEPLWMPAHLEATSRNHRPLSTHGINQADLDHIEHVRFGARCIECGCCWCCEEDCCAEYICPNQVCGCSDKPQSMPTIPRADSGTDGGEDK